MFVIILYSILFYLLTGVFSAGAAGNFVSPISALSSSKLPLVHHSDHPTDTNQTRSKR